LTSHPARQPPPARPAPAPYARTIGAILACLLVALFVKYAELRLTYELQFDPPTWFNRAARIWMALRFSWQEFAIAAALLMLVLAAQRRRPLPGRRTRVALGALRVALMLGAAISVAGIQYYAMYFGHMMITDFTENILWAFQIAASIRPLQSVAIQIGAAAGALLLLGLPWICARLAPPASVRLGVVAATVAAAMAFVTWAAGRPHLAEARLEPNPIVWFFWGPYATYFDLPPVEQLSPIGERHRRYAVTARPRNLILVVLESIPAHALAGYDPDAPAGRRLFAEHGRDITLFDQVFAGVPVSDSSILSILTGWSPVPTNHDALAASRGRPTIADVLRARGYHTEFLLTGPRNALIADLVNRGFDRSMYMQSVWPNQSKYARLAWGPDDGVLFDDARAFLESQRSTSPPFFLVMYTSNAHYPYQSALIPGLGDHPDAKVRHARLSTHVMDLLTDFYASLKKDGLADSTAVLVFGDHGQAFGEHRGNYVHSKELYWENLHVPMFLLHPTRLGLPAHITQLGSLDDVMPTALDLLGLDAPPGSGMSLLNEAPDRLLFQMTPFGPGVVGFRDRRYFYSLSRTGRELLYDRLADPLERQDIRDQRPDVAGAFRARLNGAQ